ncbi:hypothetical protein [Acinetobacter defluvii]|uniref:hypothetical protein n=1 Tax=Acinetobacter defluvii TaxID=1871111 RepID=UPI00148F308D|nr:hypothetical protein [Acinetobacter defluvii]
MSTYRGSIFITLLLLCFAIIPGVIYELWRRHLGKVCRHCGAQNFYILNESLSALKNQNKDTNC